LDVSIFNSIFIFCDSDDEDKEDVENNNEEKNTEESLKEKDVIRETSNTDENKK
jgi:hypothetical protein